MLMNGVFEGGGVRGIALVGALCEMSERGFEFSHVAGSSAGALVAALYASGYSPDEIRQLMLDTDFRAMLSRRGTSATRLALGMGLHSSTGLYNWIAKVLRANGVSVFADLERELTVLATDTTARRFVLLNRENYSDLDVAEAVTMSCSIPLFFTPRRLGEHVIVDGGVLSNYPLFIFDSSQAPTVGFKLTSGRGAVPDRAPRNLVGFTRALIDTMRVAHDRHQAENSYASSTIHIDCGTVSATDFGLTKEQRLTLYRSGVEAAAGFLNEHEEQLVRGVPPAHLSDAELKLGTSLVEVLQNLSNDREYLSVLRIGSALSRALYLQGMLDVKLKIGHLVEDAAIMTEKHEARVQALVDDVGWSLVSQHHTDDGEKWIRRGVDVAREHALHYWIAKGLRHLGGIHVQKRHYDEALDCLSKAEKAACEIADKRRSLEMLAGIRHGQAEVLICQSKLDAARAKVDEAEGVYRELGDAERSVKTYSHRGRIEMAGGELGKASDCFRRGIAECRAVRRTDELIRNLEGLASVEDLEGRLEKATALRLEAEELRRQRPIPF